LLPKLEAREEVAADLRDIYAASTVEEDEQRLDEFEENEAMPTDEHKRKSAAKPSA
jgi:transposase-like protein